MIQIVLVLLHTIIALLLLTLPSHAEESIPSIFSAGESGGSIKFGVPWPTQSSSSNPITALTYSIDGMQQVKISLDGTESPADGSDPAIRKKKKHPNDCFKISCELLEKERCKDLRHVAVQLLVLPI